MKRATKLEERAPLSASLRMALMFPARSGTPEADVCETRAVLYSVEVDLAPIYRSVQVILVERQSNL